MLGQNPFAFIAFSGILSFLIRFKMTFHLFVILNQNFGQEPTRFHRFIWNVLSCDPLQDDFPFVILNQNFGPEPIRVHGLLWNSLSGNPLQDDFPFVDNMVVLYNLRLYTSFELNLG
jgi:hypothetical protein